MLRPIFYSLDKLCDKWSPYFQVYEKWFSPYVGQSPRILEIGVYKGGSSEMWLKYFGPGTHVTGIDINPDCKKYENDNFKVMIGDTGDLVFWNSFGSLSDHFDIIIDDGGHHMDQQIFGLQRTWKMLKSGGIYLCEDTHTSYYEHWPNAGYQKASSFIEYTKGIIDGLHADHSTRGPEGETFAGATIKRPLGNTIKGIHYYNSMVVIEKDDPLPFDRVFSNKDMVEENLNTGGGDDILTIKIG